MTRRFFWPQKAAINQAGIISGSDARHIRTVLRMKAGDGLIVFDGAGNDFEASIRAVRSDEVEIIPLKKIPSIAESPVAISMAQAMLKGRKMDLLARQISELGITRWVPFFSERSVPTPKKDKGAKRLERWKTIGIESLKWSQRSRLTQITPLNTFQEALDAGRSADVKLIFWESEQKQSLRDVLGDAGGQGKQVYVVIGPEGGFSESEIELAGATGYQSVSLGPRILKAETAAVTVCALMQYHFGDLS